MAWFAGVPSQRGDVLGPWTLHEAVRSAVRVQQGLDLVPQTWIAGAGPVQEGLALARGQIEHLMKQGLQLPPVLAVHGIHVCPFSPLRIPRVRGKERPWPRASRA